jgi:hypothetical protein
MYFLTAKDHAGDCIHEFHKWIARNIGFASALSLDMPSCSSLFKIHDFGSKKKKKKNKKIATWILINLPHGDPKIGATTFVFPSPPSLNEGWTFGSKKYVLQSLVIVTLESLNCLLVLISRTNCQSDRKGLHTTSRDVSLS